MQKILSMKHGKHTENLWEQKIGNTVLRLRMATLKNDHDCMISLSPIEVPIFTTVSSAFLLLIIVTGNSLVITTIIKDPFKELRTPFHVFLLSLALADLVVGCIVEPISIYIHTNEALRKQINLDIVKVLHASYLSSASASVCSLLALTVERFVAIKYRFKHRIYFTFRNNALVAVIFWTLSISSVSTCTVYLGLIITLMVFFHCYVFLTVVVMIVTTVLLQSVMKNRIKKFTITDEGELGDRNIDQRENDTSETSCTDMDSSTLENIHINTKNENFQKELDGKEKDVKSSEAISIDKMDSRDEEGIYANPSISKNDMPETGNCDKTDSKNGKKKHNSNKRINSGTDINLRICQAQQRRLLKNLMIMIAAFLICFTPACIMIYYINFCKEVSCNCEVHHWLRDLEFVLTAINSAINPFIYTWRLPKFRKGMFGVLGVRGKMSSTGPLERTSESSWRNSHTKQVTPSTQKTVPLDLQGSLAENDLHTTARKGQAASEITRNVQVLKTDDASLTRGLIGLIQHCAILRKDSRYQKESNHQPLICRNFSSYVKCWL